MLPCILSIDQWTTGTTCMVVAFGDGGSKVLGRGYAEVPQHFPRPGWVEHDLEDLWTSVQRAAAAALRAAAVPMAALRGVGITNQRETTCLWDHAGRPVHRAIVWQDRRTALACRALSEAGHAPLLRQRTGLVIDPYFSGTKLAWLLRQPGMRARAAQGELRFGTVDSWVIWRLTGGRAHVTDVTNAARTQLFDIRKLAWDHALCALLGDVPPALLPAVQDCAGSFGTTVDLGFLPAGLPICGVAGDQHAALFGQACFTPGMAKCTYGTGAFALVNTGATALDSQRGLLTTPAWRLRGETTYALEGSVFVAGAVVQWLRDGLQIIGHSAEVEALAASVPDNGGVVLVPALTGLGAPHWRPQARGLLMGMTRGTQRGHIARAALEGIALQIYDLLEAMRLDYGGDLSLLRADGGAAANNLLLQYQADLLGIPLHRPRQVESTALGAAFLAALGAGLFANLDEVAASWTLDREFVPRLRRDVVHEQVKRWHAAVASA